MIVTIATLRVKAQKVEEFESNFAQLAQAVRSNEPDALFYQLCRSSSEPGTYRVVEAYRNAEAAEFHRTTSHFRDIAPRLGEAFASAPEVEHCEGIDV